MADNDIPGGTGLLHGVIAPPLPLLGSPMAPDEAFRGSRRRPRAEKRNLKFECIYTAFLAPWPLVARPWRVQHAGKGAQERSLKADGWSTRGMQGPQRIMLGAQTSPKGLSRGALACPKRSK